MRASPTARFAREDPRSSRRARRRLRAGAVIAAAGLTLTGAAGLAAGSATSLSRDKASATIGRQVLTLTDSSRVIRRAHRPAFPRTLVTYLRYPTFAAPSPLPLIVFVHGYDVSPSVYDQLLDAWTRAGYVVAAPVFPLESPAAPGGPTRDDLANEPADVSFVISQLLERSAAPGDLLSGRIDARHIAVAGHSDGGIVAIAVAYDRLHRDPRIGAAIVLSGARPNDGGLRFGPGAPPLLASVGTADTTNLPANTFSYFRLARRPKFLLELRAATHLPPFAYAQPWLGVVERVSAAFLDAYLKPADGHVAGPPVFGPLPRSALLYALP